MQYIKEQDLWDMVKNHEFWPEYNLIYALTMEEIDQIEKILNDITEKPMTLTELNDFFWFDDETYLEWIEKSREEVANRPF